MRGLGLVRVTTIVMFLWLWVCFLPIAISLGVFYFADLQAIYLIQACAMVGLVCTYLIILNRVNWDGIAHVVHLKMKIQENEEPLLQID